MINQQNKYELGQGHLQNNYICCGIFSTDRVGEGVGGALGISRKILETVQAAQQKPEWLVTKWEFAFPQLLNEKEKHKLSKKLEQKILTKELND